jgi:hypothetical protein
MSVGDDFHGAEERQLQKVREKMDKYRAQREKEIEQGEAVIEGIQERLLVRTELLGTWLKCFGVGGNHVDCGCLTCRTVAELGKESHEHKDGSVV